MGAKEPPSDDPDQREGYGAWWLLSVPHHCPTTRPNERKRVRETSEGACPPSEFCVWCCMWIRIGDHCTARRRCLPLPYRGGGGTTTTRLCLPKRHPTVARVSPGQTQGCSRQRGSKGAETPSRSVGGTGVSPVNEGACARVKRPNERQRVRETSEGACPPSEFRVWVCSLGWLIGCPHLVPTLGALIGCLHWVLTLGALIGCLHWVPSLGALIGCPIFISSYNLEIMPCVCFSVTFHTQLHRFNCAYLMAIAHLAWSISLFALMSLYQVSTKSNCLSFAKQVDNFLHLFVCHILSFLKSIQNRTRKPLQEHTFRARLAARAHAREAKPLSE